MTKVEEALPTTIAADDEGNLTRSFDGLRVLDFSTTIAGPHCTRMLADMGAEVIKIEPAEGETMRTRPPVRNNCSTAFGQLNIGKNSLVLDLKSPAGVEAVRRLIATADVLVENFRPGVMRRLKLDYASIRDINPKLIFCSISGYGQTGPSAELPAYAPVIHAASGYEMAHLAYQPGRSRPDYCGIYHADVLTGVYAFGAISAALYQRAASGKGQHIDVSMLESMLSLTLNELQWSQFEVKQTQRPMFGPIETTDGYVMVAIASEKTFQNLMQVIGRPDWVSDPRFAKYSDRRENWAGLMEGVEAWSSSVSTQACLAALNEYGVPSSAYRTVREALADPQIAHRGALADVADGGGSFKVLNLPFRMSGAAVGARKRMSTLGEHTLSYLKEIGLSEDQIAGFAAQPAKTARH
ncbi:crotonobetainyl-CoA:carnitine CoA-transferase CaiB-like acyl-CoA transferase [Bradyrhizobium sp. USDA 4524]|uniref:CaiB/BaiF CoA transferase family protein n=1 Tax=unclassified Bradyrhizobium TaxID=2631580 RepID=UPI00209EE93F|nr:MULTISPECIES: CoA transferase [unclassified Bradyrhizobium]MCP1837760.1 crotonobetainyl-CoA:carnitine CoA-transferase CaiB-like acyl-CoA transferase [Bradyrhizobium sp. USDA 4538]MCP1987566.1 crotonobetainyl-CoA:carnitine CoA-transferase CaiB-like acyl-CoA transferase [Bradyrhizobium sp. USDA 4539]